MLAAAKNSVAKPLTERLDGTERARERREQGSAATDANE